ncbi:hypothetical protein GPALN_004592 [Globodera pallida]|nr:hypothetical protein GPALN_004592 [Globodera pallida]
MMTLEAMMPLEAMMRQKVEVMMPLKVMPLEVMKPLKAMPLEAMMPLKAMPLKAMKLKAMTLEAMKLEAMMRQKVEATETMKRRGAKGAKAEEKQEMVEEKKVEEEKQKMVEEEKQDMMKEEREEMEIQHRVVVAMVAVPAVALTMPTVVSEAFAQMWTGPEHIVPAHAHRCCPSANRLRRCQTQKRVALIGPTIVVPMPIFARMKIWPFAAAHKSADDAPSTRITLRKADANPCSAESEKRRRRMMEETNECFLVPNAYF